MKEFIAFASVLALAVAFSVGADKEAGPVNDKCPVSGKAVNAEKTIKVGVCCGNCAKKVAKDVKGALGKLTSDNKGGGDSEPVNTKCPISGKGSKKTVTIGFCCGNCQGKYVAK